ncbi:MAG: UbiA family prenyltransferase [Chthoniobacterales bacterium]|nr:UbiA family prenyltransferase [Chthoniobacterales bacterium]
MDSAAISRPRPSLAPTGKLRAWLLVGRISNLPTIWSNCIAGCWLGGWNTPEALLLLFLGSTLLYTGGMFLNDVCDVDWDAQFRRERPIVSSGLSRRAVMIAAAAMFIVGVVLIARINGRSGMFAVALTMLIVVYNWTHKRIRTGPLLMAGCRFLLYLTAASAGLAGITPRALFFAAALGAYVAGLSYLARSERQLAAISRHLWLLLFAPVISALALNHSVATVLGCLPLILCIGWAMIAGRDCIGRAVSLLLAGIVLVDLLAVSSTSSAIWLIFATLFCAALLFQRFIPAT